MLVGGGSGGHITPLLAVAKKLKSNNPSVRTVVITERGGRFANLFDAAHEIDELKQITAGKLRRFHGESTWARLRDVKRNMLNIRDAVRLLVGCVQCLWILLRQRPNVVFIKGGYVGVPVGLVSWLLRIPYITHDSDALAGLSNRIISKGAVLHAVGMPKEAYRYPHEKTVFVGIPTGEDFHPLSKKHIENARINLNIAPDSRIILITGGSNGAKRINEAITQPIKELLMQFPDLHIIHQYGQANENPYREYPQSLQARIIAEPFFKPMSAYSAAADLIITRAGATTLAEFAVQGKACIVVPNPYLTGGHQLKNAQELEQANAVIVMDENEMQDSNTVVKLTGSLLEDPNKRDKLASGLKNTMLADSSQKIADLLLQYIEKRGSKK